MKPLFTKPLRPYVISVSLLIIGIGILLSQIVDNYLSLIAILIIEFLLLIIILAFLFERHIKPIKIAIKTIAKLVDGNYHSRFHHQGDGISAQLGTEINKLARNLHELSINEKAQTEKLYTVIENMGSGLVLIDKKGYIHLVNRKFITMFGKSVQDYLGYLYYDVLNHEEIHDTIQQTFLYEKNIKQSFLKDHANYLEIIGAPIFNEQGHLNGAVLVLYDITELKKLELVRKDFVANVSHELKTPITSIRGFAETLEAGAIDEQEARKEFVGIIHKESKRLQLLIDDLLILSKLEQDTFQLKLEKINIKTLLNEIIPMFTHMAANKEIQFIYKIEEGLSLNGDQAKLQQVLINLLANAMEYTPKNGKVTLQIKQIDDKIHILIQDTGIGMDQHELPRIFERFYRVDQARSRDTGGTGLGLAITKHIIVAHHGRISVNSKLNEGTTFSVFLPTNKNKKTLGS